MRKPKGSSWKEKVYEAIEKSQKDSLGVIGRELEVMKVSVSRPDDKRNRIPENF